jgi:hypothetical protein
MISDDYEENMDMIEQTIHDVISNNNDDLQLEIDSMLDMFSLLPEHTNVNETRIQLYRPFLMPNVILPIQDYTNTLINSFASWKPKYKKVLSNQGEKSLKKVKYDSSIHKQDMCPITQNTFEHGDEIIELPCKHYFEQDAIEYWLKHEKAECPVCRKALEHDETEVDGNDEAETDIQNQHIRNNNDEISLASERLRLYNSLMRTSEIHPYGPRQGMDYLVGEEDNDDLHTAIIASLLDM